MGEGRVLVAGGAGFIGSAVALFLLQSGHEVVVADNLSFGSLNNLASLGPRPTFIQHDFCKRQATSSLFRDIAPDLVISCVGDTFVTSAYLDPGRFFRNNVEANLNIMKGCVEVRCRRFVYLSSTEIYGDTPESALDESASYDPVNTYAVTKLAADRLCFTFAVEHGLPAIVARIFNAYGPRETHAYVIPEIIHQLSKSDRLVLGNVDTSRDFTYVEDTARAICLLLLSSEVNPGQAFNVDSGVSVRIGDVAQAIGRLMGKPGFELIIDPSRFRRREIASFRCDYRRLHEATGWRPQVSLEDGLARTVDWFLDNDCVWPWEAAALEEQNHGFGPHAYPHVEAISVGK